MSMIHPLAHPVTFACAQAGCAVCTDALVRQHQGLAQAVLRRQVWNGIPYEDLLQEGWVAFWQAIRHFDPWEKELDVVQTCYNPIGPPLVVEGVFVSWS